MPYVSPFDLGNGEHLLTQFSKRTGVAGFIKELRLSMNGWRSQMLLHSYGASIAGLQQEDISTYAASRNVPLNSLAVQTVASALRDSQPLKMRYNFFSKAWELQLKPAKRPATFDYAGLGRELRRMVEQQDAPTWISCNPNSAFNASYKPSTQLVFDWTPDASLTDAGLPNTYDDDFKKRLLNPRGWFEEMLGAYGLPMDDFGYYGLIDTPGVANGTFGEPNHLIPWIKGYVARLGCTAIVGPCDFAGRCPLYIGPEFGDLAMVMLDPQNTSYGGNSSYWDPAWRPQLFYRKAGVLTRMLIDAATNPMKHSAIANYGSTKYNWQDKYLFGTLGYYVYTKASAVTAAVPEFSFPSIAVAFAFLNDTFVYSRYDGEDVSVLRREVREAAKWRLSVPKGFLDVYLPAASMASENSVEYPHEIIHVQPTYVGVCTTMAPMRAYLTKLRNDPTTTAADRAKYDDAIAKSAEYTDSKLYMGVYSDGLTPCTLSQVASLEIVADAKKADKDLMVEDLGSGRTFTTAGKKLEKDRIAGKKYYGFVYQYDESATPEELLSGYVAARLNGSLWVLTGTRDAVSGSMVVTGSYSGAVAVPLTQIDTAFLRARGATLTGQLTDAVIADEFGYSADSYADLQTMALRASAPSGRAYLGIKGLGKYVLKPANFLNRAGYPVIRYEDADTFIRALLMYKGWGDDCSNIMLTLFFTNMLDLASE